MLDAVGAPNLTSAWQPPYWAPQGLDADLTDGELLVLGPVFGLAGAISAAGTLALAKRTEGRDLLEASAEAPEPRLN